MVRAIRMAFSGSSVDMSDCGLPISTRSSRHIAARQHVIHRQPQAGNGRIQPPHFGGDIFGNQFCHDHSRLVQHNRAEPDAFRQAGAGKMAGLADIEIAAGS